MLILQYQSYNQSRQNFAIKILRTNVCDQHDPASQLGNTVGVESIKTPVKRRFFTWYQTEIKYTLKKCTKEHRQSNAKATHDNDYDELLPMALAQRSLIQLYWKCNQNRPAVQSYIKRDYTMLRRIEISLSFASLKYMLRIFFMKLCKSAWKGLNQRKKDVSVNKRKRDDKRSRVQCCYNFIIVK